MEHIINAHTYIQIHRHIAISNTYDINISINVYMRNTYVKHSQSINHGASINNITVCDTSRYTKTTLMSTGTNSDIHLKYMDKTISELQSHNKHNLLFNNIKHGVNDLILISFTSSRK